MISSHSTVSHTVYQFQTISTGTGGPMQFDIMCILLMHFDMVCPSINKIMLGLVKIGQRMGISKALASQIRKRQGKPYPPV